MSEYTGPVKIAAWHIPRKCFYGNSPAITEHANPGRGGRRDPRDRLDRHPLESGRPSYRSRSHLKHTLSLVNTPLLSAAILDVNLRDEDVFPAALALEGLGVGFAFYTNCTGADELSRAWPKVEALRKTAAPKLLIDALLRACKAWCDHRWKPAQCDTGP